MPSLGLVFEATFCIVWWAEMHTLLHYCDKFQVFKSSGPTSPAEQPIHQQESDWLQGSGSPYTMSDTTILVPLYLFTLVDFFLTQLIWTFPPFILPTLSLSLLMFSLPLSLSGQLYVFFPQAPSLFPFLPPTGWAVKWEQAHGRPLTSRNSTLELCCRTKRLQTLLHNHWAK